MNTHNSQSISEVKANKTPIVWREPLWFWLLLVSFVGLSMVLYGEGVENMVYRWLTKEEYSHGILIPFVAAFLIWQKRYELELMEFSGSWLGSVLIFFGLAGYFVGELSSLYIIVQYSFLIFLYGIFLSIMGWWSFKKILMPLLILIFMIPLPNFIYNNLSSELQLISSEIGVWFIRLFDIAVYLEGNIIDLGSMQLQVVEACNGLRYLFPLMTLGFILAYCTKIALWKKVVLFISSIPITILMNSFRIGAIGVTVEYWGPSAAEGFLHDFEGWIIFLFSFIAMLIETWLLSRLGEDSKKPFGQIFGLYAEPRSFDIEEVQQRKIPKPFMLAIGFLLLSILLLIFVWQDREEILPQRDRFESFPMQLEEWQGFQDILEQQYIDALKLDDYLLANYTKNNNAVINLYIAYYASQSKGASAHSPRSCIPGGGWLISEFDQRAIELQGRSDTLPVNRAVIRSGDNAQLVYYWFQQRGRIITNEYLVKWYIFWDALTRNRSDGALIRLVIDIKSVESVEAADEFLAEFANQVVLFTEDYIPR